MDPELFVKQQRWVDELLAIDMGDFENQGSAVFAGVSNKFELAAIWLSDSIHARSIDFPQNDRQLMFHRIYRSRILRALFNIAVLIQIILPFFATPGCAYTKGITKIRKFIIVDIICLLIYAVDLFLSFSVNPSRKRLIKKPWSSFRILCCFLLFLDVISYSNQSFAGMRIVRCVFPFFLISRRTNLQRMLQGLMSSGYKSLPVVKALLCILLMWSFFSFLVFRNISSEDGHQRFETPWDALFTSLHCFTSRPYCLLALKPFFAVSQSTALYFVTLTIAADVLCIGLIVAIATQEYKKFAQSTLQHRLRNRLFGLRTLFDGLAEDGRLSREAWLSFTTLPLWLQEAKTLSESTMIFCLEDKDDTGFVDFHSFLRLTSLLANRVVVLMPVNSSAADSSSSQERLSDVVNSKSIKFSLSSNSHPVNSGAEMMLVGNNLDEPIISSLEGDDDDDDHRSTAKSKSMSRKKSIYQYRQTTSSWIMSTLAECLNSCIDYSWIKSCCQVASESYLTIELTKTHTMTVTLRSLWSALIHLLLVIQLGYISSGNASPGWYRLGDALEFFFWLDMLLRLGANGWSQHLSSLMNRAEAVINVASLVSCICLGSEEQSSKSAALVSTIIIQSMRFFGIFFWLNDVDIFERIFPILIRAGFIYFSIIYFFSILAHSYFCDSLDASQASAGDDDSSSWVQYSSELNFSTYLQSLFTMFEMSILANWSIVMDAAEKVSGPRAYVFFYTFRLIVTLNVLPLLLGFVMQAFLAARKAKEALLEAHAQNVSKSSLAVETSNDDPLAYSLHSDKSLEVVSPIVPSNSTDSNTSSALGTVTRSGDGVRFKINHRAPERLYAVTSAGKGNTSRTSLWGAELAPPPPSPQSPATRKDPNSSKKDLEIDSLRSRLEQAEALLAAIRQDTALPQQVRPLSQDPSSDH